MFATIGIIIDIVIIAAFAIFTFIGIRKGFLHSLISLFSWTFCLLVAFLTAKYVAGWINGIFNFSGMLGNSISDALIDSNNFFGQAINSYASKDELLKAIPSDTNGLLKQLIKVVFSNSSVDMSSTESIGSVVGIGLGQVITIVITGILIFIILKVAVMLLNKLFKKIAQTKVLGTVNKVLGGILGFIKVGFIVIGLNLVLCGLSLIPLVNKTINPLINENTFVEKFAYNKTDELFSSYILEGKVLENWVDDLWENKK